MATSTALSLVDVVNALQTLSVEQTTLLSLHLGVKLYTLDGIESQYRGNPSSVKSHSLQAWLQKDTEACWEKIVSGLQQIGMNAVAKRVATTYCPKARAPDSTSSATGHAMQPVHQPVEATGSEVTPSSVITTDSAQHPSLQVCTTHPPSCDNDRVAAVKATIAHLEERFSDVMSETQSAMCVKERQDSNFLDEFRDVLFVLPVAKKVTHVKFFRESEDEIVDARNMRKVFVILSRYCSYTNYEILLQIVDRFCDALLKKSMQEYCDKLKNFEVATTIDVYLSAISASKELSVAFANMALKIKKPSSECSLHEIRKLKEVSLTAIEGDRDDLYADSTQVVVTATNAGAVFFTNSAFWGPSNQIAKNPDLPRVQGKEPTKEGLEKQEGGGTGEKGGAKEVPSYYEYSEKYPGIRFFGDPLRESVTEEGKLIDYWEEEIGVKFDIPRGAVPQGKQLDLSVWPCTAGPFVFPEGYELASPVYQIAPSFKFQCDITLTLHHFCAVETAEQCESMAFLSSSATPSILQQQEPQYRFKVLSRGSFLPSEAYGSVSLKHFCNVAVGVKRKRSSRSEAPKGKRIKDEAITNKYALKMYYKVPEDMVVFSASLRHPKFFTRLKRSLSEYFPDDNFRPSIEQPVDICGSKVELHWPKDKGWELFPDTMPCVISRDTLDSHESADYPPMIKVDIKPIPDQTSSPPPSSHIEVEVLGVSEKLVFMLAPTAPATRKTIMPARSPLSPPQVKEPILKDLLNNVVTTKWYRLGLQLTNDETELDIIKEDHGSKTPDALRETFKLCIRRDPELTWQKIVNALREIKENHLARDIEEKFCH